MLENPEAFEMLPNNTDLCSGLHSLLCFEMHLMSRFSKAWVTLAVPLRGPESTEHLPHDKQSEQLKGCLC